MRKRIALPPRIRAELLSLLKMGKKNAISAKTLSNTLGLADGITSESLRLDVIKPMIEEDHIPIGSCSKGYYLIETKEEFNEVWEDLNHRIRGMRNRQGGLAKGFDRFRGKRPTYRPKRSRVQAQKRRQK